MRGLQLLLISVLGLVACGGSSGAPLFSVPVTLPGFGAFAVSGSHVFAASGTQLHVFELRGDTNLTEIGAGLTSTGVVSRMAIRGDALYFQDDGGVQVADISDPSAIGPVTRITGDFDARAFTQLLAGSDRYVGSGTPSESQVTIWDLVNPLAPAQVGSIPFLFGYGSVAATGNLLLIAQRSDPNVAMGYVEVWDVSNPASPQKLALARGNGQPGLLYRYDDGLVLCGRNGAGIDGPTVLDVRNPAVPVFHDAGEWKSVALFAFAGDSHVFAAVPNTALGGGNVVRAWDLADSFHPVPFGDGETSGGGLFTSNGTCCTVGALVADGRHVYTAHSGGLTVVGFHP